MDKATAIKFLDALAWFEHPFGELELLLSKLEGDEREAYKKIIGQIALNHFDLIMPIINQYPDLDPDGKGKQAYANMKLKHVKKDT